MRLRSPIRQVSVKTAAWKRWRDYNYGLLGLRCQGRCEGCQQSMKLDPHHVWGRGDEPFSSMVESLAGLCRPCHDSVTGMVGRGINVGLRGRLASDALRRLNDRFGMSAGSINTALSKLKRQYEYSPSSNSLTRKAA